MANDPNILSDAEAMIIPLGAPITRESADFEGTLEDVRHIVSRMSRDERGRIVIWTPGHLFGGDELLAESEGHEHDPLR